MTTRLTKEQANEVLVKWAKSLPLTAQLRRDKEDLLQWVRNRIMARAETCAEYVLKAGQSRAKGGGDEWFMEQAEWYAEQAKHYRELLDWASEWLFRVNFRKSLDSDETAC